VPDELAARALDVASGSFHDAGWSRDDALDVLVALHGSTLAVLGGDVYVRQPWGFAATTESWSCERAPGEATADYAIRSREWAKGFVLDYRGDHDAEPVFVLYFDDQQGAA